MSQYRKQCRPEETMPEGVVPTYGSPYRKQVKPEETDKNDRSPFKPAEISPDDVPTIDELPPVTP